MEKSCTLLVHFDKGTPMLENEIKEALEGNDVPAKVNAMRKAIMLLLNGEPLLQLFITVVRYVLPSAPSLVSLSSAPTAIRTAVNTYCMLLLSQSDNNVKLIVLDHQNELRSAHCDIMVELIMDVLRALSSPNLDIRKKTLDIRWQI